VSHFGKEKANISLFDGLTQQTVFKIMNKTDIDKTDRVRDNAPEDSNKAIDKEINDTIALYKGKSKEELSRRIIQLEKEWSIERHIETFAPSLILSGLLLSRLFSKKWLILPAVVSAFLLQHGIQGWCPPVPMFRAFKVRTRKEIDWEKYALKILRGDFDRLPKANTQQVFQAVRKL
jgi:hypothetical protein